jgi:integrase
MRAIMGLIKNSHGVYHVRKKVPEDLQEATTRVLGNGKARQTWLKRSLGTKDLATANKLAKPVLIEFDRTLERARELLKEQPRRRELSRAEIARMGEYHYTTTLADDEASRREGRQYLDKIGLSSPNAPKYGLTDEELERMRRGVDEELPGLRAALARGDVGYVEAEILELIETFQIRLDPSAASAWRALGMEVLRQSVKAFEAIQRRYEGEWIETPPPVPEPTGSPVPTGGGTLSAAFSGWQRERERPASTVAESERAVRLFTELHGDMAISAIRRSHAYLFREALKDVPRHRPGKLAGMSLPELAAWGREHPDAMKITPATVNKQLGAVQAICRWAHDKGGMVPEEIAWADPFARQRLTADEPTRDTFTAEELNVIFSGPVFTANERPLGGKGDAAFWLPLLGLFTGARRSELSTLTADNVDTHSYSVPVITITEDKKRGKRVKTRISLRTIPLRSELLQLGFLEFAHEAKQGRGTHGWLFPEIAPDRPGGTKAWSKWFGRYLDHRGVINPDKVFHSFRHTFMDALRAGGVSDSLIYALTGHSQTGGPAAVGESYGAKQMVRRFGIERIVEAIARAKFPAFDLSQVRSEWKRQAQAAE